MKSVKKILSVVLSFLLIVTAIPLAVIEAGAESTVTYYIDAINGDNSNLGTSEAEAWKDLGGFKGGETLTAGVSVLFKCGGTYDFNVTLEGLVGTKESPFVISSYGEGERPILTTNANDEVLTLIDCSYISISDLQIVAPNGGGIWIDTINATSEGITIDNVYFHGMPNGKVNSRDDHSHGAAGARAAVLVKGLPANSRYPVNDLTITNCEVYDCANGFMIWGSWNDQQNPWCEVKDIDPVFNTGLLISDCYFHDMDAEAVVVGMCDGALVTNCRAIDTCQGEGVDENGEILYFTASMWFWGSINSTIQYCEIAGQKNVGDGMTVDFDSHTFNCTYQYIYSHDNMRFMCNNSQKDNPQKNNTVRYCLSVNDNYGRSAIASGNGEDGFKFYNNTIINCGDFHLRYLTNSFVANNIIIPQAGSTILVNIAEELSSNNTYENNCYYNVFNPVVDAFSMNVYPTFVGGDNEKAYQLAAGSSLIGAGTAVGDELTYDLFGNEITSNNIGCYAGTGEPATQDTVDTENENIFGKLVKFVTYLYNLLVHEINNLLEDL